MLEKPDLCPEEIYDLMKRCWKKVPADRISMTQLHHCLSDMLTTMQQLIDYVCLLPSPAGDLKLLPVQNVEENLPLGAVAL